MFWGFQPLLLQMNDNKNAFVPRWRIVPRPARRHQRRKVKASSARWWWSCRSGAKLSTPPVNSLPIHHHQRRTLVINKRVWWEFSCSFSDESEDDGGDDDDDDDEWDDWSAPLTKEIKGNSERFIYLYEHFQCRIAWQQRDYSQWGWRVFLAGKVFLLRCLVPFLVGVYAEHQQRQPLSLPFFFLTHSKLKKKTETQKIESCIIFSYNCAKIPKSLECQHPKSA